MLPLAIDRAVWIALRPRDDRRVLVHSIDFDESAEFSLDDLAQQKAGWIEYLKGVAWACGEAGHRLRLGGRDVGRRAAGRRAVVVGRRGNGRRSGLRRRRQPALGPGRRWPSWANGPKTAGSASIAASWTR